MTAINKTVTKIWGAIEMQTHCPAHATQALRACLDDMLGMTHVWANPIVMGLADGTDFSEIVEDVALTIDKCSEVKAHYNWIVITDEWYDEVKIKWEDGLGYTIKMTCPSKELISILLGIGSETNRFKLEYF